MMQPFDSGQRKMTNSSGFYLLIQGKCCVFDQNRDAQSFVIHVSFVHRVQVTYLTARHRSAAGGPILSMSLSLTDLDASANSFRVWAADASEQAEKLTETDLTASHCRPAHIQQLIIDYWKLIDQWWGTRLGWLALAPDSCLCSLLGSCCPDCLGSFLHSFASEPCVSI